MALRNQPYLPLYVQDYLTDEKLSVCSWATQGIYIKILCIFHKQTEYGSILFKQTSKQNESKIKIFASILIRLLPCQLDEMIFALEELIENDVLKIDGNKLYQSRMVKDGQISLARSKSGKKGGGNPILFKQTSKQTVKQNPEYENEYNNIINELMNYFKFNEIKNSDKFSKAFYFIKILNSNNKLEYFEEQFKAYKKYKAKNKDEKKHSFESFIGTVEEHFLDGGWNKRNWKEELKEEVLPPVKGMQR